MIEVAGLRKAYGGRTVLDGVDLAVRPGELVALLGPNGAGKTTTVEIVEGYRTPDGGHRSGAGRGSAARRPRAASTGRADAPGRRGARAARDVRGPRPAPRRVPRGRAAPRTTLIDRVGLGRVAAHARAPPVRRRAPAPLARARARRRSRGADPRRADGGHGPGGTAGDPRARCGAPRRGADDPADDARPRRRRAARRPGRDPPRRPASSPTHRPTSSSRGGGVGCSLSRSRRPGRAGDRAAPRTARCGRDPQVGVRRLETDRATEGATFEIEPGAASADVVLEVARWAAQEGLLVVELQAGAASLEERYLELTGDRDVEAAP